MRSQASREVARLRAKELLRMEKNAREATPALYAAVTHRIRIPLTNRCGDIASLVIDQIEGQASMAIDEERVLPIV